MLIYLTDEELLPASGIVMCSSKRLDSGVSGVIDTDDQGPLDRLPRTRCLPVRNRTLGTSESTEDLGHTRYIVS